MDNDQVAQAVGHIPSGLFIITSNDGEKSDGYLASWVQQVSFDPMIVAFALNDSRPGYEIIKSGKAFCVNVVGDHNMNYLKHFWRGYSKEDNPFAKNEIEHKLTENGAPLLTEAKSSIECEFISSVTPGDHEVVFAKVINSHVHDEASTPKVHIRKSGLDY